MARHRLDRWLKPYPYPRLATEAGRDYWLSFEQINRFALFVIEMVTHIQTVQPAIHETMLALAQSDEERARLRAQHAKWQGPLGELAAHSQFFNEIFLVRHVENYLSYLSALLFRILSSRPEAMRSQEKVELEFVLEHKSFDSLVRGLAERKVDALSYSSFDHLATFFEDHFHLAICGPSDLVPLRDFIETRNISVHNRCTVDTRYLEKIVPAKYKLGERRYLGVEHLEVLVPALHRSVRHLDRDARKRLSLRGSRFNVGTILQTQYDKAQEKLHKKLAELGTRKLERKPGSAA
jgi:hypothetical protein